MTTLARPDTRTAVAGLLRFLETGSAPEGLFAPDLFIDVSLPQWRVQGTTADEAIAIRLAGHASPGRVHVSRLDETDLGFVLEFEERWEEGGQQWYCRELVRADVVGATIVELSVYCTGDWDEARQREHAQAVQLIRA
jgi:hypothetical protein